MTSSAGRWLVPPPRHPPVAPGPVPTFSVVIAAYQSAATIADAVTSALGQTTPPLEIVVCDDGSTDDLEDALAPYRKELLLVRKENGGEASAKNTAARAASGDFVAILDADDTYLPERLAAIGSLVAARPDLDVVTTDAFVESDGKILGRVYDSSNPFEVEDQRREILRRNFVFGLAAVRRSVLLESGGYDESIQVTTDWELWIRLVLGGSVIGLVDAPLATYRFWPASLSADVIRLLEGRIQSLRHAARSPLLTSSDRRVLSLSMRNQGRRLALAQARRALVEYQPDARRRALAVALGRGHPAPTRFKAVASALMPVSARKKLTKDDRWLRSSAGGTRSGSA